MLGRRVEWQRSRAGPASFFEPWLMKLVGSIYESGASGFSPASAWSSLTGRGGGRGWVGRGGCAAAAGVFRALCVRIGYAAKSKDCHEAPANPEEARRCYQAAGLDERWKELVTEMRRDHHRKSGFMPASKRSLQAKGRGWNHPSSIGRAHCGDAKPNRNGTAFATPQVLPLPCR